MKHNFIIEKRKIIVTAKIKDRDFRFILDTGATTSVIDSSVAVRLGFDLKNLASVKLTTAGGSVMSKSLKLCQINLFDTEVSNFDVSVINLPYQITLFASGLIGMDFLLKFKELKINFDEKYIETFNN